MDGVNAMAGATPHHATLPKRGLCNNEPGFLMALLNIATEARSANADPDASVFAAQFLGCLHGVRRS